MCAIGCALALGGCSDDNDVDVADGDGADGASRTAIVETANGPVQGLIADGVSQFLGIPFAASPVGDLRWRPPESPESWTETLETTAYGDFCAQTNTLGVFASPSASEDCLYLNVFAPRDMDPEAELPVMVWIYGGALFAGESDDYDGSKLVAQGDVVVVTFNYRLNVFGFLSHPALDDRGQAVSNYGLMDQQFAFRWVKDNIAAFGGDPDNVTIFGESAGGRSVLAHLVSPAASGLFERAIIQSGAGLPTTDLASAEAEGVAFAEQVGCQSDAPEQTTQCLRALSVEEIQSMALGYQSRQILPLDGTILTQTLDQALTSGDFNQVPIVSGTNKDENTLFIGLAELNSGSALTADEYTSQIESRYGDDAEQVLAAYPLTEYDTPGAASSAVTTDSDYVCPALEEARRFSQYVPLYAYEFIDRTAPAYAPPVSFDYGAYHTSEIQYLFPLYAGGQGTPQALDDAQQALSDDMVGYWTRFADVADPNSDGTPDWPAYAGDAPQYQSLELPEPVTRDIADLAAAHYCDLWDALAAN
ncbi:carboxylesterase [Salinisphaera orenii YIM 95161]|uniref:Carboxylic ester hydrolase n=1 Tax=Salinisphaera orenii YIM 95161 TaxID=1051139 RepID=A0A423Q3P3_9GAMM|nr:carboxylesterase [Salinisphaera halophila YIM 95161]